MFILLCFSSSNKKEAFAIIFVIMSQSVTILKKYIKQKVNNSIAGLYLFVKIWLSVNMLKSKKCAKDVQKKLAEYAKDMPINDKLCYDTSKLL